MIAIEFKRSGIYATILTMLNIMALISLKIVSIET